LLATGAGEAMRGWRIAGAVLVSFAILLLVGVAAADRWLAAQRERLAALAAEAIGRELVVQRMRLDVWGHLGLQLTGMRISGAPEFGGGEFVAVPRVRARLAFWPLLQGRIEIGRVTLEAPRLRIARDARGRWNYESLRLWASGDREARSGTVRPSPGTAVAWLVAAFDVENGQLDFVDRSVRPERCVKLRHWFAQARNVGMDRPFKFELRAAIDADEENLELRGEVGPLRGRDAVPVRIHGAVGPHPLAPVRVEIRELRAAWRHPRLEIESLRSGLLGGELEGRGSVGANRMQASLRASGLDVEEIARLAGIAGADRIEGRVALEAEWAGEGWERAAIERSLIGSGRVAVTGGLLRGWNAVHQVWEQLAAIPGFEGVLGRRLKLSSARALARQDTRFQALSVRFAVGERRVRVEESEARTEDYDVHATGSIDFSGMADLHGTVALSRAVSSALASDAKAARSLMDAAGRVSVPFRYRGPLGAAKPMLDAAAVAETLRRRWLGGWGVEVLPPEWRRGLRDLVDRGLFGQ